MTRDYPVTSSMAALVMHNLLVRMVVSVHTSHDLLTPYGVAPNQAKGVRIQSEAFLCKLSGPRRDQTLSWC